jgi:hypothetical protein
MSYCSKECQKRHRETHRRRCKTPITEPSPVFPALVFNRRQRRRDGLYTQVERDHFAGPVGGPLRPDARSYNALKSYFEKPTRCAPIELAFEFFAESKWPLFATLVSIVPMSLESEICDGLFSHLTTALRHVAAHQLGCIHCRAIGLLAKAVPVHELSESVFDVAHSCLQCNASPIADTFRQVFGEDLEGCMLLRSNVLIETLPEHEVLWWSAVLRKAEAYKAAVLTLVTQSAHVLGMPQPLVRLLTGYVYALRTDDQFPATHANATTITTRRCNVGMFTTGRWDVNRMLAGP